jgi:CDP-glucose 4,6-dehydratase
MESLDINPTFWHSKKVFITGHTGFKGAWLSLWLQSLGAHVSGYALPPKTSPNLYDLAEVGSGMNSRVGDICDFTSLKMALRQSQPEIIFHMAAQAIVRKSYEDPIQTYQTNIMGTVYLLEAIRECNSAKALVNVTSDKCYENREWLWGYRENEAMGGRDPYSSSKACSELVTSAYRESFFSQNMHPQQGLAIATARAGNVIGGGDWSSDRLVPDLLESFRKRMSAIIRNPMATRPWQHVLEPLRGYLMLAEALFRNGNKFGKPFNFGPENADVKPVSWVANELAGLWGNGAGWIIDEVGHPHEAHFLKLDISRAKSELNWKPLLPLSEGLIQVMSWSKAHEAGENMRAYTLGQIKNYQKLQHNEIFYD